MTGYERTVYLFFVCIFQVLSAHIYKQGAGTKDILWVPKQFMSLSVLRFFLSRRDILIKFDFTFFKELNW